MNQNQQRAEPAFIADRKSHLWCVPASKQRGRGKCYLCRVCDPFLGSKGLLRILPHVHAWSKKGPFVVTVTRVHTGFLQLYK